MSDWIIILAKVQFDHSYTFWNMPILIFSPGANFGHHPLGWKDKKFLLKNQKRQIRARKHKKEHYDNMFRFYWSILLWTRKEKLRGIRHTCRTCRTKIPFKIFSSSWTWKHIVEISNFHYMGSFNKYVDNNSGAKFGKIWST